MIPFCRIFVHFLWWIGTLVGMDFFFEVEIHEDLTRFCENVSGTLQLKGCLLLARPQVLLCSLAIL